MSISNRQYNFELNYTPYDFFYSTNRGDLPNETMCGVLEHQIKEGSINCENNDNMLNCYQHELCKNKDLVNKMYKQRNDHATSNKSYDNLLMKYNYGILKTINLSVGIVGSLVFIYYYNK
mgnify:CR=1 FL=1|tara:strand:+ start:97 stop:456 length:360 start_codon:yes stop_codon:yes gene_type:complete